MSSNINWLTDEDYKKAVGQLRRQMTGVFDFMKVDDKIPIRYMYGMEAGVSGAVNEMVKLAEDFGLRVRGVDKAIDLEMLRRKHR